MPTAEISQAHTSSVRLLWVRRTLTYMYSPRVQIEPDVIGWIVAGMEAEWPQVVRLFATARRVEMNCSIPE